MREYFIRIRRSKLTKTNNPKKDKPNRTPNIPTDQPANQATGVFYCQHHH